MFEITQSSSALMTGINDTYQVLKAQADTLKTSVSGLAKLSRNVQTEETLSNYTSRFPTSPLANCLQKLRVDVRLSRIVVSEDNLRLATSNIARQSVFLTDLRAVDGQYQSMSGQVRDLVRTMNPRASVAAGGGTVGLVGAVQAMGAFTGLDVGVIWATGGVALEVAGGFVAVAGLGGFGVGVGLNELGHWAAPNYIASWDVVFR